MTMETSLEVGALAEALAKAQAEIKGALKDSANPFFNSKYADLESVWEACRPALTSNGIAVIQAPFRDEDSIGVTTMLLHTSGQWARSAFSATPKDLSPQSVGSVTTYLRRYGLSSMAGVAPQDDDGNAAQGNEAAKAAGPSARAARRELAKEQTRRDAVDNAPYAERERAAAALKSDWPRTQVLMKKWPPAIAAIIPPDEALYLKPPADATQNRDLYLNGIRDMAERRKLSDSEIASMSLMFFGSKTAQLDEQNTWTLRALWTYMEPERD